MVVPAAGGGTVTMSDGTKVTVPANALGQDTAITVATEPNSVTIDGASIVGTVYRFGPEGTQFSQPATVTLAFDPAQLPAGTLATDVVIMTAPVGSTAFVGLPTSLADATHVSAATTHFSDFAAIVKNRKNSDFADLAQTEVAADMSPTPADLTSSSSLDLTGTCAQTYSSSTCTLTANGGTATQCGLGYSLNCQQTFCYCSGGNLNKMCPKAAPDTNTLNCPGQANMETIWFSCCMFP
jgi:hypothetical protein